MRIGVAKKTFSARLPLLEQAQETRVCEGRATANMPCIPRRAWSTLLCFSIWSMRDKISFPEDMRCAASVGRAGGGAVAML